MGGPIEEADARGVEFTTGIERDEGGAGTVHVRRDGVLTKVEHFLARFGVLFVTIALIGFFGWKNHSTFLTIGNLQVVSASNSVAMLLALAALVPLVAGEFDLSVGAVLELSAVVVAVLLGQDHLSIPEALICTMAVGGVIGLLNGLLIARLGLSSFIATLGVGSLASAFSLRLTNGQILIQGIPTSLVSFGQGSVHGVPTVVIIALAAVLVGWIVLEQSTFGRQMLALGLSRKTSELVGIRVNALLVTSFVVSGVLASLAGFLELSRVGSASAGIGPAFLLPALAAGFLGATTIKVGRFNVLGTALAVTLVAIGVNGLELNGVPQWVEPAFDGGVLLVAVGLSRIAAERRKRRGA